jgi:hypothetical protein
MVRGESGRWGDVPRVGYERSIEPEEYTRLLGADVMKKGWLRRPSNLTTENQLSERAHHRWSQAGVEAQNRSNAATSMAAIAGAS